MKLADIGNMATFGSALHKQRNVGNWSYYELVDSEAMERVVFHYGTMMGRIVRRTDGSSWEFVPVSAGWGSVSDQAGMNKIIRNYGWYYSRKGGNAQYVEVK